MCGNFNGDRGDDFLSPAGLVESLVEDFGNAWKLHPDCPDLRKQHADPCSRNPRQGERARRSGLERGRTFRGQWWGWQWG